ncbi:MAG: amidohydrolase [Burkholderiales bacterium]|nr:amidohydrolase [Burkholderiales bacterium]
MIVDAHVHYIEPATADRPYADPAVMVPISVDELLARTTAAGVDKIVQVTASTMGYDNRYSFEGAAQRSDRVLGCFGRLDPMGPDVADRLAAFWARPGALGIRLTLFHGWSRHWLAERAIDPFLQAAAALDVPVALFAPFQAGEVLETARRHPGVRFLIDHALIRHEAGQTMTSPFRHWPQLLELAALPKVWTKVSYFPEAMLGNEAFPYPTAQQHLRVLHEHVGADRLVWGSNFPPVQRACTYAQSLDFIRQCGFFSDDDRRKVLGATFLAEFARGHKPESPPSMETA